VGLEVFDYLPELVGLEEEMQNIFIHKDETYFLESVCKQDYYVNISIDYYDENNLLVLLHDITNITLTSQKLLQYSNESILINNTLEKILNNQNALLFCTYENKILYSNAQFINYFCIENMIDKDVKNLKIYQYMDEPCHDYDTLFEYVNSKEEYLRINNDMFIVQATSLNCSHSLFTLTKVTKLSNEIQKDLLTGAYKKTYFDSMVIKKIKQKDNFVLVVLDFDDFKIINDTYGHQVGDTVLQEFSVVVKDSIRKQDIFARWGGEEFLLLLEYQNIDDVMQQIERLRDIIEKHTFAHIKGLTVSLGVASREENDDIHTLLQRADQALYEAKKVGKNKVIFRK
jgi:diguanylate cyclase (GGDEF)-like protein